MDYASLLNEIYGLTKRPDLTTETTSAVKAATLQMHGMDYFAKDIYESGISFATSDYFQSLDYKLLLPRWRAPKYFRKYDAVGLTPGKILSEIPIEKVLDGYKIDRQDIWYLAGGVIQIRSATKEQYYLFGAYLFPSVDSSNYISWIADEYPYAIVYKAVSMVYKMIGLMDEAKNNEDLSKEFQAEIIKHNIVATGS